jgi:hypothetical protein
MMHTSKKLLALGIALGTVGIATLGGVTTAVAATTPADDRTGHAVPRDGSGDREGIALERHADGSVSVRHVGTDR